MRARASQIYLAALPALWTAVSGANSGWALLDSEDPLPVNPQFQVNSYTSNEQLHAAIAQTAAGSFVVAWMSRVTKPGAYSIQGRCFGPDGSPIGDQFQVNGPTTRTQLEPAIAGTANGSFVVVWQAYDPSDVDSSLHSIQGRRFAACEDTSGSQFLVNDFTPQTQRSPGVAMDTEGGFVVVWSSWGSSGTDTDDLSVQGKRYAESGAPEGSEFQVNSYTARTQSFPVVARDDAGNFLVVWESLGSSGMDTHAFSVQAQRYSATGNEVGSETQVNVHTWNHQRSPAVAVAANGDFVVAWQSDGSTGSDTSFQSIQGRRYSADGSALGGEFQINSYTTSSQVDPAVGIDSDGDFVVVWSSSGSNGSDSDGPSIQGRRYAANGDPLGGEFQINSYTTGQQHGPQIAIDGDGDFVVVWSSLGSPGDDSSDFSVQGQRFRVTGDLQGTVFRDLDSNGLQGGAEPGIAAVTVELRDANGVRRTTVTDATGQFVFRPKAGLWTVRFVPPMALGYAFSPQDVGSDDTVDSDADPLTGETDPFSIAINALEETIDAGFLPTLFADGFESGDSSAWSATFP